MRNSLSNCGARRVRSNRQVPNPIRRNHRPSLTRRASSAKPWTPSPLSSRSGQDQLSMMQYLDDDSAEALLVRLFRLGE